jgi:heavy metal efflux system protein
MLSSRTAATSDAISNLRIGDNEGHFIPLAQLADIREEEGPAQISRENGQRRISVEVNVRGRDLAGFVAEAQKAVTAKVTIPSNINCSGVASSSNWRARASG